MKPPMERKAIQARAAASPRHAVQGDAPTAKLDDEAGHPCFDIIKEVTNQQAQSQAARTLIRS